MSEELELLVERSDDRLRLLSPDVGLFTLARRAGVLLGAGEEAGCLLALGRAVRLVVPAGVEGRVVNQRPDRVHQPVGFRALLYELTPVQAGGAAPEAAAEARSPAAGLVYRSPQSGRFYHRPSPEDAPFVAPGSALEPGTPLGLLEVMKTFAQLHYRATAGLPERARVVRVLVADGGEVAAGDPLVEVEPE